MDQGFRDASSHFAHRGEEMKELARAAGRCRAPARALLPAGLLGGFQPDPCSGRGAVVLFQCTIHIAP